MPGFMAGNVTAYLKLNTTGWTSGMRGANTSLQSLARTSMRVGAALIADITIIMREYGKFDKAIRHATSVSELSQAQFEQMSKMALDASVQWNKAASETAQAFYYLGSAGLTATEQMDAFNHTIMLSRAMGSDLSMTVEGLVDIVRAFGLEFENTAHIADILTKTVISSNQHFSDLDKALSYAGATAAFTNNTLEETTAMLGIMANAGIKGSMAGTVLRRALANLVSPTAAMSDLIYELGLNVYDSTGQMKPFIDIMGQISDAMAGASEEYRNMVFKVLFGVRAIGGQIALFNYGSQAIKKYADEIKNAGGVTEQVAEKQMKAFTEQLGKLYREAQRIAISLGGLLAPAIGRVAGRLIENARGMDEYIKTNSKAIAESLKWVTVIGASALLIPPLALMLTSLANQFTQLSVAMGKMVITGLSIGWKLAGPYMVILSTLYVIRALLKKEGFWDDVVDFFVSWIDRVIDGTKEGFKKVVWLFHKNTRRMADLQSAWRYQQKHPEGDAMGPALAGWDESRTRKEWERFDRAFRQTSDDFAKLMGDVGEVVLPPLKDAGKLLADSLSNAIEATSASLKEDLGKLEGILEIGLGALSNVIPEPMKKAYDELKKGLDSLGLLIDAFMQESPFAKFYEWLDEFNAKVRESRAKWEEAHKPIVAQTKQLGSKMGNAWNNALREMFDPTEGFIITWKDLFFDVFSNIRSEWSNTISSILDDTYEGAITFKNIIDDMINAVRRSFTKLIADLTANQLLFSLLGKNVRGLQMGTAKWGDIFRWMSGQDRTGFEGGLSAKNFQLIENPYTGPYSPGSDYGIEGIDYTGGLTPKTAVPAISFNLNNQTTMPVTAKPAGTSFNGKQWVVDVVLEEMRTNRGFADQIRRG